MLPHALGLFLLASPVFSQVGDQHFSGDVEIKGKLFMPRTAAAPSWVELQVPVTGQLTIEGNTTFTGTVTHRAALGFDSGTSLTLTGPGGYLSSQSSVTTTGGVFANDYRVSATAVDLDAAVTAVGVSTAQHRVEFTAVGVSTAQFRTEFTAVGVSTAQIRTELTAIGVSTSQARTEFTAVGVSTANLETNKLNLTGGTLTGNLISNSSFTTTGGVFGNGVSVATSAPTEALSVTGNANISGVYKRGTRQGSTVSACTSSQYLGSAEVVGGILVAGACTADSGIVVFSSRSLSNQTFTNTTGWPCLSNSTLTWTSGGRLTEVSFSGTMSHSGTGSSIYLNLIVDGAYASGLSNTTFLLLASEPVADYNMNISVKYHLKLSAASHSVCLAGQTNAGTVTIRADVIDEFSVKDF